MWADFYFGLLDNPQEVADNAIISAAKDRAMRLFFWSTSARFNVHAVSKLVPNRCFRP